MDRLMFAKEVYHELTTDPELSRDFNYLKAQSLLVTEAGKSGSDSFFDYDGPTAIIKYIKKTIDLLYYIVDDFTALEYARLLLSNMAVTQLFSLYLAKKNLPITIEKNGEVIATVEVKNIERFFTNDTYEIYFEDDLNNQMAMTVDLVHDVSLFKSGVPVLDRPVRTVSDVYRAGELGLEHLVSDVLTVSKFFTEQIMKKYLEEFYGIK